MMKAKNLTWYPEPQPQEETPPPVVFEPSHTTMIVELVQVTPELAARLLKHNAHNRPLREHHVNFLAEQMRAGNWKLTGDTVKLSKSERLLDGQHRLSAIIKANVTIEIYLAHNCEDDIFDVLDTGRVRNARDVAAIYTDRYPVQKAALASLIIRYESGKIKEGRMQHKTRLANATVLNFLKENDLTLYVEQANKWYGRSRLLSKAEYGFLFRILSERSPEEAEKFLTSIAHGTGIEAGSPLALLRQKLELCMQGRFAFSPTERIGLAIKAWNFQRKRERPELLRYTPDKEGMIKAI